MGNTPASENFPENADKEKTSIEIKEKSSVAAAFDASGLDISEPLIKEEPETELPSSDKNKKVILNTKITKRIGAKELTNIFTAIEGGFENQELSTQFAFPHPKNWVGPRFMSLWVIPIFLIKKIIQLKDFANPIRPYSESNYSIGHSETIYTSSRKAFEGSSSMRFFGARFLTIWVLPFAITGIFMEYLFVSPMTGRTPFG